MKPTDNNHNWASPATSLQHAGKQFRLGRGLIGATESSVTFSTPNIEDTPVYSRLGNTTNHFEAEDLMSHLHRAPASIVTGSGMACLNLIVMTLLRPGDHVLVLESCYGGTYQMMTKIFSAWGIETTFAPMSTWEKHKKPNTRMVLFESITNPFCEPQDIGRAAQFAKTHKLISVCDNTFASPALCQPLSHGVDLVFESATKYLNGHSDVIAGMIAGSKDLIDNLRSFHSYLGTFLPPQQCMQLLRGMRTLDIRMKQHSKTGLAFAEALRSSGVAELVSYGVQATNPTLRYFANGFGGMVSVRFSKKVNVKKLLTLTRLVTNAPSLGGTESTATMPAFTTNWFMTTEQKKTFGIDEQLVRFSIGLEEAEDIVQDVLAAAKASM